MAKASRVAQIRRERHCKYGMVALRKMQVLWSKQRNQHNYGISLTERSTIVNGMAKEGN